MAEEVPIVEQVVTPLNTDTPIIDSEKPTQDAPSTESTKPDDLIGRATRFVEETKPANKTDDEIDEQFWGDAELNKKLETIEDPQMREQLKGLRKSLITGANNKYKELAGKIKEIGQHQNSSTDQSWTPERINQLMQDPGFVNAAQQAAGTPQTEESDDDYLPDSVKQKLAKLDTMEKQLTSMQSSQQQQWRTGEHERLSTKYGNYNPQRIDEVTKEVLEGKAQISIEDIYKATTHDDNVKRAYEMGRKDGASGISEAEQLHTLNPVDTKPATTIVPEKGESDKSFFMRGALARLAQSKKSTAA